MENARSLPHSKQPVICESNQVHASTSNFLDPHFNIIHKSVFQAVLLIMSPNQNPVYISSVPIRATCPAHLILLYVITRISGEDTDHKVPCSVAFSTSLISSLWGPNILLIILFSNTTHWVTTQKRAVLIYLAAEARNHAPSAYVPPSVWATKFHTHTKVQAKLQSCII